ncbi:hypothetical protein FHW23_000948 [Curtobacterium pusillum]|uniref:Glycosyltransferase n=1 Tax=Curtobacterium pusillum TaxID=69373 RepID=A0AAW3T475_9MICO|nr:hypothetical protein [Curtobacterium pusillum]MBA8989716.1 hypothetical protein [Curtobacterium pusillum]
MRPIPRDPFRLLSSYVRMAAAAVWGHLGRRSLVAPGGPVVSLTTFGVRVRAVHLTLVSIGRGTVRPSRLIVWVDDPALVDAPPPGLARLRSRGLEVRLCEDLGPHKKYFPYVSSVARHRVPMVTADDDVLYPRRWLETLVAHHLRHPDAVVAHRVNRIVVEDGCVAPYARWGRATSERRTPRNYAVGVKGILYPPAFLDFLRDRGDGFRSVAPRSSDTWLHHCSLRAGVPVLPVVELGGKGFWPVRGLRRSSALLEQNVLGGRNDRVRSALWSPDDLAVVLHDQWPVDLLK